MRTLHPHGFLYSKQSGFALLPVVIMIVVIAAVSLLMSYESSMNVNETATLSESKQAMLVAEAGMAHAKWQLAENTNCSEYTNIQATSLGIHTYTAHVSPNSGSPVTVTATGVSDKGISRTLTDTQTKIYQTPFTKEYKLDATGKDTFIEGESGHTDHNKGNDKFLKTNSESNKEYRVLLQFDVSDLPISAKVISATLELYLDSSQGSSDQVLIHRITDEWLEDEVTWIEKRSGFFQNWSQQGGDYASHLSGSFTADAKGWKSAEITKLVQGWVGAPTENHGMILLSTPSSGNKEKKFISSDNNQTALHPKLTITYACECGVYCEPPTDPLGSIAHWKLDDESGSTALDSVSGHDGTLMDKASWGTGKLGGAINLNGDGAYIQVPHDDALSLTDAMTFSAWINVTSFSPFYQTILAKDAGGASSNYWFGIYQRDLSFGFWSGHWFEEVYTTGLDLQMDTWYHVAASFDNATDEVTLYLDGIQVQSGKLTANPTEVKADITIGLSPEGEFWHGLIDDIRINDLVLEEKEIMNMVTEVQTESGGSEESKLLPPEGSCAGTFRDEFNLESSYSGSDGTLTWTTDWLEINERDGPDSGDERIINSSSGFHLRIRDNDSGGEGVQREADLSANTSATLTFEYLRDSFDSNSDYVTIGVSNNGGITWDQLDSIGGAGTDSSFVLKSYDISKYITQNTRIRFLTSPYLGGGDEFHIDNVQIEISGCATK